MIAERITSWSMSYGIVLDKKTSLPSHSVFTVNFQGIADRSKFSSKSYRH